MEKKVLMITPSSGQVIGFRKKLIESLQEKEIKVSVIVFDEIHKQEIIEKGIDFYCVNDANRGLNPFKALTLKNRLAKLIKKIKPDVVFTFMLKPNVFGVPAAKKSGVKEIFSMVEGAGDVFINNSIKWKLIRAFVSSRYKKAFKICNKVFFLNNDDKKEFVSLGLINENKCVQVCGVGVDLDYFAFKPIKNHNRFIMIARLLKNKGVIEYCKCARFVKQKYPDAQFDYLGAEGTIKVTDIQEYIDDGSINYLGTTQDVRPFFEECFCNILPSYREGFGLVNAEAAAIGRMSLGFDTIGVRDSIKDGYTGILVQKYNWEMLAKKIIWCIENPEKVVEMGENARKFAQENFDCNKINKKILDVLGL